MTVHRDKQPPPPGPGRARRKSFLLRVWSEPPGAGADEAPIRVRVKDLETGEETTLSDLDDLGDGLLRALEEPADQAIDASRVC